MKNARMLVGCAVFAIAGQAAAVCTNQTRLMVTGAANAIVEHLSGNTVCGTGLNANAGDRWQEWHQAGGTLTEYARGPSHPVDPTHDVGTWSTSGMGNMSVVNYTYNGGGTYSFSVHVDGAGTTFFCSGGTEVAEATLISGRGACP